MKSTYVLKNSILGFIFTFFTTTILIAQVGIGTTTPDDSAALDIDLDDAGFLMPRVTLTGTDDITTISGSEEEGLLVYNTVNAGSGATEVFPGFYFWDGTEWVGDLTSPVVASSEDDWTTLGNAGTDDTVNFIGTNDDQDLVFKGDGNEYMRLSWDTGFFGINTTAAEEFLDVNGDIDFGGGATDYDGDGENIKFRAQSDDWWIAANNSSLQSESSFYIGTSQDPDTADFRIENNGYVNIGGDNEFEARDMLHVTNDDENETTVIRIDNTRNSNSIFHTALELWDGSTEGSGMKAFFRHNNRDNILEIGQTKDDGIVNFYSGDSSGSNSAITMTLDDASHVGIGTTTPDDSAALDIDLDDAGFLMPRVSLTGTTDTGTVSGTEATGLLVYNTANVSDVTAGFYYWDGSQWVAIGSGGGGGSANAWLLTGNSGTDDSVNYIGTNDNEDVVFSADGNEYMRLSWDTGFFGINTSAAEEYLDVNGDIDMGGGSSDWDSQGENIKFRARSENWWAAAKNASSVSDSHFYIGTTQNPDNAEFLIANNGFVNIGSDNEYDPLDMLHVTNDDENETTTIRIDNTRNSNDIVHTSLELWDGSSSSGQMAFFNYNNNTETVGIGAARGNGSVEFYSGDGSGSSSNSSEIAMVIDTNGNVGIGNDDTSPDDLFHVTKDQDAKTTIRIDNTNTGGSSAHTSLELWDGSSSTGRMAFFNHRNDTDLLLIGHARGNGEVRFYSGNGGASSVSSSISMTLENDGHVTIQTIMNLNPGSAPSSPAKGDIYYDSSDDKVKVYTGSGWENLN